MAETLLGEELVEMVWERTMGTSSDTGTSSAEEMGDGLLDELLEPATVELLAALVDGEVLSNGVGSEAGVRDGVGVSAKLAGAEAPANLAAGAGAGAGAESETEAPGKLAEAGAGAGAPAKLADAFVGAGSPKASKLLQDGGVDERRFCFSCFPTDGRIEGTLPPTTIL